MAHEYGFHVGRRGFFGTIPLPSRCPRCNSAKIHRCWSLGNIGIKGALFSNGYGSIPMKIPFLGGWTSIYQLFWCELQGDRVLTHPHMTTNTTRSSIFWGQHGMKPKSTPDIEVKVTVPGPQGAGDFGQRSRRQPCSGPSKGKRSRKFWGE
jgi:hypothetical protein